MERIYGLINNRFEEGHNFNSDKLIHDGDDITMYYYSDRTCYFVDKVINQKEIVVGRYYICADHEKSGGMGHQDWKYFKTHKEEVEYLKKYFPDQYSNDIQYKDTPDLQVWVYRYNKWQQKVEKQPNQLTEKEKSKVSNGKKVYNYYSLPGKISFGVKNYHYDWEF